MSLSDREYVFGRTEEGLRYRKNHHQEEPRGPAGPETNLIRKGMAWHWRGFSVGLYVLLLEFNHIPRGPYQYHPGRDCRPPGAIHSAPPGFPVSRRLTERYAARLFRRFGPTD